jgi:hypothetical protein
LKGKYLVWNKSVARKDREERSRKVEGEGYNMKKYAILINA